MSDEAAMEKWSLFHSILKNSPMMKTGTLRETLRGHIKKSRFHELLNIYEQKNLIIRPTRGLIVLVETPKKSLFPAISKFFEKRREREKRELLDKILYLKARQAIRREVAALDSRDPQYRQKISGIEYKWFKKYGLTRDPLKKKTQTL